MDRRSGSSARYRPQDNQNKVLFIAIGGGCLIIGLIIVLVASGGNAPEAPSRTVVVEQAPEIELVDVLVPTQPIQTGAAFMPEMFRTEQKPRLSVPSGVISRFEQIQGQYAKSPILVDQPISDKLVTSVRPVTVISSKIPEGFRAVTIPVDQTTGVEGWAKPGAKVDVVLVSSASGRNEAGTIVCNAEVLSAGANASAGPNDAPGPASTVTLLVSPEDAVTIQLAQTMGKLSLSLRGDSDGGAGGYCAKKISSVFGEPASPAVVKKKTGCVRVKRPEGGYDELCLGDGGILEPSE